MRLFLFLIGSLVGVLALWLFPKWHARGVQDLKDRLTLENATRQTWVQILGGVLIVGLLFTWKNLQIAQETATKSQENATKTLDMAREGQITDRFTKAIEQLGDNNRLTVRLGGIYALERIAKESEKDHGPIMEVLTAYVREEAPWLRAETLIPPKLAPDIQAVLTVLGRRSLTHRENQPLNLRGTALRQATLAMAHLKGVDLSEANLREADLNGTNLEGADLANVHLQFAQLRGAYLARANLYAASLEHASLVGAHLEGASLISVRMEHTAFWRAHLEGADLMGGRLSHGYFSEAHLQGANFLLAQMKETSFTQADLEGANLVGADLQGASFSLANLRGANLTMANIEGARHLTVEQLATVKTLYNAHLDPPLLEQIQRQHPHLLEKPQNFDPSLPLFPGWWNEGTR